MSHTDLEPFGLSKGKRSADTKSRPTVTTTWVGDELVKDDEMASVLFPAWSRFPLGRAFGIAPVPPGDSAVLPWGLGLASIHRPTPMGDLSRFGYDPVLQVGVVHEDGRDVPLCKHTDGTTQSVTHPDGHKQNDSDTDHRED